MPETNTYKVPGYAQDAARRALKWRRDGAKGGTEAGVRTARAIATGVISEEKLREIAAWFARHGAQPKGDGFANASKPTPKRVAYGLWGDPGNDKFAAWVRSRRARLESCPRAAMVERATGMLPEAIRSRLMPPKDLPDGSREYDVVIMRADTLDFGGKQIWRGPEALQRLVNSGRLEALALRAGPYHPEVDKKTGGFRKLRSDVIGALHSPRWEEEIGAIIGKARIYRSDDQKRAEGRYDGVSLGYYADEREPTDAERKEHGADVVVEDIYPDHIITTDAPRGGSSVALRVESLFAGDDLTGEVSVDDTDHEPGETMKIKVGEMEYGEAEIKALLDEMAKLKAKMGEMDHDKLVESISRLTGERDAARADLDRVRSEAVELARETAQVASVSAPLLGKTVLDLLAMNPGQIKRQVVGKVYGEAKAAKDKADPYVQALYEQAVSNAESPKSKRPGPRQESKAKDVPFEW